MKAISAISARRLRGAMGTWLSYQLTRISGRVFTPPLPFSLAIEPTTSCNLRCPECPSGLRSFTRPTGNISLELYHSIIDQVAAHCGFLTFYFQGEPFLHPNFLDMVGYATEKKIFTVTSTNAHYLDAMTAEKVCHSGLGRLIISLDGITQQSYEKYRVGGELEKVEKGILEMVQAKRKLGKGPELRVQFILMKHNQEEVKRLKEKAKEWGIEKVMIKTVQVYSDSDVNALVPENEKLSRYHRSEDGTIQLRNEFLDRCWKLWSSAVITWDGRVVPCCFDKDASYVMGKMKENTFEAIWSNKSYQDFRRRLVQGRKEIDICKNCSEGTQVFLNPGME